MGKEKGPSWPGASDPSLSLSHSARPPGLTARPSWDGDISQSSLVLGGARTQPAVTQLTT